ncbi:MAG: DUF3368 domain-containing protein [Chlorobi bacterium]|nr:DUF3368 domain-containing protein [Chlorobiota bacterium]
MKLVADTSALIALSTCEALDLLDKMFDEVFVTKEIYDECIITGKPYSKKLSLFLKDKIKSTETDTILNLPSNLGKGEISAMLLSKMLNADYLLIDDSRARKIAKYNQIKVIGSVGVLLQAKKQNLIKSVSSYMNKLENSGLFMSQELINEVKRLAKE